jgi:AraC-like DNA-binding protein
MAPRGFTTAATTASPQERARHWRFPGLPGVDLLRARYVRHTFIRHTHETFVIAGITAGARLAERARDVLEERMADPPTLERLATSLGARPFPLLRAFRDRYGMPPHAWLTDARVHRARCLLDAGVRPAEAAVAVGFTDQPHLNRHFTRAVGVPPGAYQRERNAVRP